MVAFCVFYPVFFLVSGDSMAKYIGSKFRKRRLSVDASESLLARTHLQKKVNYAYSTPPVFVCATPCSFWFLRMGRQRAVFMSRGCSKVGWSIWVYGGDYVFFAEYELKEHAVDASRSRLYPAVNNRCRKFWTMYTRSVPRVGLLVRHLKCWRLRVSFILKLQMPLQYISWLVSLIWDFFAAVHCSCLRRWVT